MTVVNLDIQESRAVARRPRYAVFNVESRHDLFGADRCFFVAW